MQAARSGFDKARSWDFELRTIVAVTFVLSDGIVGTLFLLAQQFDNSLWSSKLSESVESLGLDETVRNQRE